MGDSAMINSNPIQPRSIDSERVAAERTAAYWIYEMRLGRLTRDDITKRLLKMTDADAQLHRDALNKFRQRQVRA